MRVGLVSDTHGRFDPRLPELLQGCDLILHAGDVVGLGILEELRRIAPVVAVRGNNDKGALGDGLAEVEVVPLEDLRALVIHELGKPEQQHPAARRAIQQAGAQIVVHGHSHQPSLRVLDGILYINPGSAGPRRFSLPRTAALLTVRKRRAHVGLLDLEDGGRTKLPAALEVEL